MIPYSMTDNWSCLAYASAHLVDATLDDFVSSVGHDGSEMVKGTTHPEGRRSFRLIEAIKFFKGRGFTLVEILVGEIRNQPRALFSVAVKKWPMNPHWASWKDGELFDGAPGWKGKTFEDYTVVGAWAIVPLKEET
jgi:hypothetical protein